MLLCISFCKLLQIITTSVEIVQIVIGFVESIAKIVHEGRLSQDVSLLAEDVSQDVTALAKYVTEIARAENKIP